MTRKRTPAGVRRLNSGNWQYRLVLPDRTRESKTFKTEREASNAYWQRRAEIDAGHWFDDRKGAMPFRDFLEQYMQYRSTRWSAGTMRNNRSYAKKHLVPTFGGYAVRDIRVDMVERWYEAMPKGTNSLNIYRLMTGAMKTAVRWGYIQASPCIVERPGTGATKKRPRRTEEDFRKVLAHVEEEFRPVFLVIFTAHLRISEAAGLNRGDWDPFSRKLSAVRQYSPVTGQLEDTKTGQHKSIRLMPGGEEALETYIQGHPALADDPMFYGPKGGRLTSGYIRKLWKRACAAAGYVDFHVHDNRRTSLTVVMDASGNWKAVKMRGGHASDSAALAYQDFSDELDSAVISALEARTHQ